MSWLFGGDRNKDSPPGSPRAETPAGRAQSTAQVLTDVKKTLDQLVHTMTFSTWNDDEKQFILTCLNVDEGPNAPNQTLAPRYVDRFHIRFVSEYKIQYLDNRKRKMELNLIMQLFTVLFGHPAPVAYKPYPDVTVDDPVAPPVVAPPTGPPCADEANRRRCVGLAESLQMCQFNIVPRMVFNEDLQKPQWTQLLGHISKLPVNVEPSETNWTKRVLPEVQKLDAAAERAKRARPSPSPPGSPPRR